MALISKTFENGHLKISILGIKMSFDMSSNYLYHSSKCNNRIYLKDENGNVKQIFYSPKGMNIEFRGTGASVYLTKGSFYKNVKLQINSDSVATIEKTKTWGILDTFIEVGCNSEFFIGENFNMVGGCLSVHGDVKLHIGRDCMFSNGINIMCADGHRVVDMDTSELINKPQDITIGNKVWLARNVAALKGSKIPDNSIISFGAVVTSEFDEPNVVLGGVPAKAIKKGIDWSP